jgi:hypothetical protein
MRWQSSISCVNEPQQLWTVAFEVKAAPHQLQFTPSKASRPLAKRIEVNVWSVAAILDGHRRLHPGASDGVEVFYANAA